MIRFSVKFVKSKLNLLMGIDIQDKDAIMAQDKQQVFEKALKMSNSKPFVHHGPTHTCEILSLIDGSRPVQVYRNLHKKCWSVRQDGLVKCHTDYVILRDCRFKVSKLGRQRVLRDRKKNVHAFVEGYVCASQEFNDNVPDFQCDNITYNPYEFDSFVNKDSAYSRVDTAAYCDMMCEDSSPVIAYGAK